MWPDLAALYTLLWMLVLARTWSAQWRCKELKLRMKFARQSSRLGRRSMLACVSELCSVCGAICRVSSHSTEATSIARDSGVSEQLSMCPERETVLLYVFLM